MAKISSIEEGSIAAEIGLKPGDKILSVDGHPVRDYIDFQYHTSDHFFTIQLEKLDGELWEVEIDKYPGETLGIHFNDIIFDSLKLCKNNCLFCFVKQQPAGLRGTLNLKDDDYRFSFMQGSFITLTNLSEKELNRIISMRLSPLNISVHATNPDLRIKLMKNPAAGKIMQQLKRLADAGIKMNTQVVLCPGLNDGEELDRTISDLATLYPAIISLGIVPVGLTKFRKELYPLEVYKQRPAGQVLKQIANWQSILKDKYGQNWLYASDEFYLVAEADLPSYKEYNGFPQIENGVGLTRLFWSEMDKLEPELPDRVEEKEVGIITGILGSKVLKTVIERLQQIKGLTVDLIPVENYFFGQEVTVTGLITGSDIIRKLKEGNFPARIIIPGIAINDNNFFLDDLTFNDLGQQLGEYELIRCDNLDDLMEVILDE